MTTREMMDARAAERAAFLVRRPDVTPKSAAVLLDIVAAGPAGVRIVNYNTTMGRCIENLAKRGLVTRAYTADGVASWVATEAA